MSNWIQHIVWTYLVERKVIVELKAVEQVYPPHKTQLLTYLKLSGLELGLLINFNVRVLKDGISRVIYDKKIMPLCSLFALCLI